MGSWGGVIPKINTVNSVFYILGLIFKNMFKKSYLKMLAKSGENKNVKLVLLLFQMSLVSC